MKEKKDRANKTITKPSLGINSCLIHFINKYKTACCTCTYDDQLILQAMG